MNKEYFALGHDAESHEGRITGYAAIWDAPSEPMETTKGPLRTVVRKGAFASALAGKDIFAFGGHDDTAILGRVSAGTLKLTEDARGLRYEITPPDTSYGRDILALVARRDLTASSFGMWTGPNSKTKERFTKQGDGILREILEADLFEVSIVAMPRFPATDGLVSVGQAQHSSSCKTDTLKLRIKMMQAGV